MCILYHNFFEKSTNFVDRIGDKIIGLVAGSIKNLANKFRKEDKDEEIACPSKIQEIDAKSSTFYEDGKTFVSIVDVDLIVYRQKNDMKMVRRNVTLPNWLNREAEAAHINVSRVLQEALMSKLNISKMI